MGQRNSKDVLETEQEKRVTAENSSKPSVTSRRDMSIVSDETRAVIQEKRSGTPELRRMLTTPRKQCG